MFDLANSGLYNLTMKNKSLGQSIKVLREEKGISLSELARRADISKAYLYQLEEGTSKKPSATILFRISRELGITIAELLGEDSSVKLEKSGKPPLPSSLKEAIKEYPELDEVKDDLISVKLRGKYPQNKEDWYWLYKFLNSSTKD